MNVIELLRSRAAASPDAPAIIDARRGRSRVFSFAELERASARAAGLLHAAGLRPGDGVLVLLPMSAELYVALLAIFRLGMVALILDPSAGRDHIERCCALYPPQALIASARAHLLRLLSPALRRIPLKVSVGAPIPGAVSWGRIDRTPPFPAVHPCDPATPALLTFTSGSTGQPKAAVRSHGFLLAQHRALQQSLELAARRGGHDDAPRLRPGQPGVRRHQPDTGRRPAASGCDTSRTPCGADPCAPTPRAWSPPPPSWNALQTTAEPRDVVLPSLRKVLTGGGPVFPRVWTNAGSRCSLRRDRRRLRLHRGRADCAPGPSVRWTPRDRQAMDRGRGLPAGFPVPSIQLRILRDQWGTPIGPYTEAEFVAACLPPGEAGEIVVSGDHVLAGYLHGHGNDETKFAVGGTRWHRTGDAGYLDAARPSVAARPVCRPDR